MRLLANENLPGAAVEALRQRGYDVVWIRTDRPDASDREVLALAERESRLLLTFDKHFGELAFHAGLPAECGVTLSRIPLPTPHQAARAITAELESRTDWSGSVSVVEPNRVRMVALPRP